MNISVTSHTLIARRLPFSLSELETALALMLPLIPASSGTLPPEAFPPGNGAGLELALLDDAAMADLNLRHLGSPGPTNILAFPAPDGALGWMALSVETIRREAKIYAANPAYYTLYMLAHGLTHLRGHSHGQEMDRHARQAAQKAQAYFHNEGLLP